MLFSISQQNAWSIFIQTRISHSFIPKIILTITYPYQTTLTLPFKMPRPSILFLLINIKLPINIPLCLWMSLGALAFPTNQLYNRDPPLHNLLHQYHPSHIPSLHYLLVVHQHDESHSTKESPLTCPGMVATALKITNVSYITDNLLF